MIGAANHHASVLTDSKGRKVDFSNTIIIMTSNLGATALRDDKTVGFGAKDIRFDQENMEKRMSFAPKPTVLSSRRAVAPRFDVMMIIVFEKSTLRPLLSVKTPSSRTCKQKWKTS